MLEFIADLAATMREWANLCPSKTKSYYVKGGVTT